MKWLKCHFFSPFFGSKPVLGWSRLRRVSAGGLPAGRKAVGRQKWSFVLPPLQGGSRDGGDLGQALRGKRLGEALT